MNASTFDRLRACAVQLGSAIVQAANNVAEGNPELAEDCLHAAAQHCDTLGKEIRAALARLESQS